MILSQVSNAVVLPLSVSYRDEEAFLALFAKKAITGELLIIPLKLWIAPGQVVEYFAPIWERCLRFGWCNHCALTAVTLRCRGPYCPVSKINYTTGCT